MDETIKKNLDRMESDMGLQYWRTSASGIMLLRELQPILERFASGRILDAGAGSLLCKPLLEKYTDEYESLDIIDNPELDYQQDLRNTDLPDNQFNTVFCRNVIEHIPEPKDAFEEIHRLLKDSGYAIITVPHLAYLHNEPHDYYRFTEHSLRKLANDAQLDVEMVIPVGGFFSFVGYSFSTLSLGLTYNIPLVSYLTLALNSVLQRFLVWADDMSGNEMYFPLNYLLVCEK